MEIELVLRAIPLVRSLPLRRSFQTDRKTYEPDLICHGQVMVS